MLQEILRDLNHEQRAKLKERGITRINLSQWRTGERLPTEVQVADLTDVTGAEWSELQKEITVLRAPENRRADIAKALGWRKR